MYKIFFSIIAFWVQGSVFSQVSTITGELSGSGGLSLDSSGNLYIADFGDFLSIGDGHLNDVYKMTPDGNVTVYATGFGSASGNAFNSQGILYQADIANSAIFKIENNSAILFANTNLANPVGIVFNSIDELFVCNCGGNSITKILPDGTTSIFSSSVLLNCPNGITIDENNNLYVSNFYDGGVIKLDLFGNASVLANVPGSNNGHLRYCPVDTNIYVCSHGSSSVYKVDLSGNVSLFAGTGVRGNDDGTIDVSTFSRPNGIAISVTGDTMYINSSIPLDNGPGIPLNPSVIRQIINAKTGVVSVSPVHLNTNLVTVFPNPGTAGLVTIAGEDMVKIEIYSTSGELALVKSSTTPQQEYDVNLETGQYIAHIFKVSGAVVSRKILIE